MATATTELTATVRRTPGGYWIHRAYADDRLICERRSRTRRYGAVQVSRVTGRVASWHLSRANAHKAYRPGCVIVDVVEVTS